MRTHVNSFFFPQAKHALMAMLFVLAAFTSTSFAQKEFAAGADIDQCANGSAPAAPVPCNWINGNLNRNNSQWAENESVPYRMKFSGLAANTPYTIVIGYDTTEGGVHTFDFLTTNDRSNVPNACDGVSGCNNGVYDFEPIPQDPNVTGAGVTPIPGEFRMYGGGDITGTSAYVLSGTYAGSSQTQITLNFNSGNTPNSVVLSWSGHIASRFDWGFNNAAIALSGSSYHMRISGGTASNGNQDRSMKVDAIVFPGYVTIRKQVNYLIGNVQQTTSTQLFGFTSTNFTVAPGTFGLKDDRPLNAPNPPIDPENPVDGFSDAIVVKYETFGQSISVTESIVPGGQWSLIGLTCSINGGGNQSVGTAVPNFGTRTGTIVLQEANIAECVFQNGYFGPSAAPASVQGRVTTAEGRGISGAYVTISNATTGEQHYAVTNSFGYYRISGLPVSEFYIMTVNHKRYLFLDASHSFTLDEDMYGVDFTASAAN